MTFVKCTLCGRLVVAGTGEDIEEARRRHAELDEAALASLRALFPAWVNGDGVCASCDEQLRMLVGEPEEAARW